jgi:hypothetical protein
MQQLEIAKKSTSKYQNATKQVEEIVRREKERIEGLITSRRMYRLENSNIFYIESSKDNIFYFCKYSFGSPTTSSFCSCKDFEYRGHKRDCYHLNVMIPMGIMKGKIIDVSALPKDVVRDNMVPESYRDDDYDF